MFISHSIWAKFVIFQKKKYWINWKIPINTQFWVSRSPLMNTLNNLPWPIHWNKIIASTNHYFYVKMTFSYEIITSSMEFLAMQSRTPDKIMPTRRSSAWKCGSHSTGNVGSILIDSFSNCDNDFGPFWNLFGRINTVNWNFPRNQFQCYRNDGKRGKEWDNILLIQISAFIKITYFK